MFQYCNAQRATSRREQARRSVSIPAFSKPRHVLTGWPYRVSPALALLLIVTLLNLRGLRETGTLTAVPVYLFVVTYLLVLAPGNHPPAGGWAGFSDWLSTNACMFTWKNGHSGDSVV